MYDRQVEWEYDQGLRSLSVFVMGTTNGFRGRLTHLKDKFKTRTSHQSQVSQEDMVEYLEDMEYIHPSWMPFKPQPMWLISWCWISKIINNFWCTVQMLVMSRS